MKHTEYIIPIGEDAQDYDEMFIGVIRRQPELVRCKDCKHRPVYDEQKREMPPRLNIEYDEDGKPWIWDDDMTCPYLCGDSYYNQMPDDEQFCDRGERKEE